MTAGRHACVRFGLGLGARITWHTARVLPRSERTFSEMRKSKETVQRQYSTRWEHSQEECSAATPPPVAPLPPARPAASAGQASAPSVDHGGSPPGHRA